MRLSAFIIGFAMLPAVASADRSLEQRLFTDAADGELNSVTLLQAALIAGGLHDDDAIRHHVNEFDERCQSLAEEIRDGDTEADATRVAFHLMHKFILTGQYELNANSVARTLHEGNYNCLTATIVYQCLCDRFQLPVVPVTLPGHVRNRFATERQFEIEPTCPNGFDHSQAGEPSTPISAVQLVARIYYNRATVHLQAREFADAIRLLHICSNLDPEHSAARTNLLAAINNSVLALCEEQQFSAAMQRLQEGLSLAPDHEPFLANDIYVHGRWVRSLCKEGDFEQALAVLEAAHRRRPDVPMFDRGRSLIAEAQSRAMTDPAKSDDVAAQ